MREYHWNVGVTYKLVCFAGNDPDKDPIELQSRSSSTVIITKGSKEAPLPEGTVHPFVDVPLTWLLQQITTEKQVCRFQIDRSQSDKCRTPRRNEQVDAALEFFRSWDRVGVQMLESFQQSSGTGDSWHARPSAAVLLLGYPISPSRNAMIFSVPSCL